MMDHRLHYPRPQFLREQYMDLTGTWNFAFDDEKKGLIEKWQDKLPATHEILVPFTYETKLSGIHDEGFHPVVWYERSFHLEEGSFENKDTLLHLEGCDYHTTVWVNGQCVGTHKGAYSRFSFDVSHCLKLGENRISIRVEDSWLTNQPRGKQRWKDHSYGCWYVACTGLWKPIWMESLNKSHLESIKLTPNIESHSLQFEAKVNSSKPYQLKITASFEGEFVAETCITSSLASIQGSLHVYNEEVHEWGMLRWNDQAPNLYDLEIQLIVDDSITDTVTSYFGMREITIREGKVYLNNVPLYQKLILDQGYWKDSGLTAPNVEAYITDIEAVKKLGFNGVRKHQKTEDERFLYLCDKMGLLVWEEMASPYSFDDSMIEEFTKQWMELVKQNYNHPSIITWTPFNESWGIPRVSTHKAQQNFTQAIYYTTKAFDPYRPVVINDGWEHTKTDIVTLHDYEQNGENILSRYTKYKEEILSNKMSHQNCFMPFAQGFAYEGQPIIISEYGGIAYDNNDSGWGYGEKVKNNEEFLARYDSLTSAMKSIDYCVGYCYTQITDVQQEINGLLDMDRNFKLDPEEIAKINRK